MTEKKKHKMAVSADLTKLTVGKKEDRRAKIATSHASMETKKEKVPVAPAGISETEVHAMLKARNKSLSEIVAAISNLANQIKDSMDSFSYTVNQLRMAWREDYRNETSRVLALTLPPVVLDSNKRYDVVLTAAGLKKIRVIKTIRDLVQNTLREAKDMTDRPSVILSNVCLEEGRHAQIALHDAGASVLLREYVSPPNALTEYTSPSNTIQPPMGIEEAPVTVTVAPAVTPPVLTSVSSEDLSRSDDPPF